MPDVYLMDDKQLEKYLEMGGKIPTEIEWTHADEEGPAPEQPSN